MEGAKVKISRERVAPRITISLCMLQYLTIPPQLQLQPRALEAMNTGTTEQGLSQRAKHPMTVSCRGGHLITQLHGALAWEELFLKPTAYCLSCLDENQHNDHRSVNPARSSSCLDSRESIDLCRAFMVSKDCVFTLLAGSCGAE